MPSIHTLPLPVAGGGCNRGSVTGSVLPASSGRRAFPYRHRTYAMGPVRSHVDDGEAAPTLRPCGQAPAQVPHAYRSSSAVDRRAPSLARCCPRPLRAPPPGANGAVSPGPAARGHPRAASHREDPGAPGPGPAAPAQGSGARGGARPKPPCAGHTPALPGSGHITTPAAQPGGSRGQYCAAGRLDAG